MTILEIKDFYIYLNNIPLIKNLNLTVKENELLGISCPSGSGKTSLLNFISNTMHESENFNYSGSKTFYGSKISYVFQEARFIPQVNIHKNLLLCCQKENIKNIEHIAEMVNISDKLNCFPQELSGGQLQRASIARALLNPFDLLLLDEPFAFQDEDNKNKLIDLIKKTVLSNNKCGIIVSHNKDELKKISTRIIAF